VAAIQNIVEDAGVRSATGRLDVAGRTAVLSEIPVAVKSLKQNHYAGLPEDIWNLNESVSVGAEASGGVFDPGAADFRGVLAVITAKCASNGTPIELYATQGG
jgi:hypothetical protein